jgi:nucleotide-binding universal stress UspA family protein
VRVLVGTDGSDQAIEAARQGLALLAADQIVLVCVVETPAAATAGLESGFAGGLASPDEIDSAWAAVKATAQDALDRTAAVLGGSAEIEPVMVDGDPGSTICLLAEERDIDAIVIGSRGHGAVRRALLGSVSTYVVNNAPCAVVVVPASAD